MKNILKPLLSLMGIKTKQEFIDLTQPLTENTPVFPGDPAFRKEQIESLEKGSNYNLSQLCMGNHTGTHIDFPKHVIHNGKDSSHYTLSDLTGEGLVIEYPDLGDDSQNGITKNFILSQNIRKNDIVFFKTSNGKIPANKLSEKFIFLEKDGAEALVKKQVKMVGIVYMSIDSLKDETLPVHHTLLENDIPIVENLAMNKITPGRYYFYVIPLNIPSMDGQQVRAFAQRQ